MKRALPASWLVCGLLGWGLLGCGEDLPSQTEIAITVVSDLKVPDDIDYLTLDVTGLAKTQHATADLAEEGLPRHLTLVHDSGPVGPIVVIVTATHDGKRVVENKVQLSFQLRTSVEVTIELQSACKDVFCDADQTCRDGECHSIPHIDPKKPDAGPQIEFDGGIDGNGGSGGGPGSMVKPGKDAMVPMSDPDGQVPGDTGPPANQPPVCEITSPDNNESYNTGASVELTGTCTDPENGILAATELHWTHDTSGGAEDLGSGSSVSIDELPEGTQVYTLCAADPDDATLQSECGKLTINVTPPGPAKAEIVDILQNGDPAPFEAGKEITFLGMGSGTGMLTYSWTDSFDGAEFGIKVTARMKSPEVGRHHVTFSVTDANNDSDEATADFDVVPAGESTLVQPFDDVNSTLEQGADAIAVDSESQVLASRGAMLYRFDATNLGADAKVAITGSPSTAITAINQIFIAPDKLYLATTTGLVVCDYDAGSAIDGTTCGTYNGGGFPSNNVTAVTRATVDDVDVLVVGTDDGLFVPDNVNGSTTGATLTGVSSAGRTIRGIVKGVALDQMQAPAANVDVFWFTGSNGELGVYIPAANRISERDDGKTFVQNSIAAAATEQIWVGTNQGVSRWTEPKEAGANGGWQYWTTSEGNPNLPTASIFAVATTHVTLGDDAHDIVWVGSNEGLMRFDAATDVRSLEQLTTDDGLPGDSVIAIAITPSGDKLISTDAGLAIYVGP